MQFCILLIGVLVFVYYQYNSAPLFFNSQETAKLEQSIYAAEYQSILTKQKELVDQKALTLHKLTSALDEKNEQIIDNSRTELQSINHQSEILRDDVIALIKKNDAKADTNDNNYVFLHFVTTTFPKGLIGLLIAIIMLASMGATASAINSLASTTVIDIYKRFINKNGSEKSDLRASRISTLSWGIFTVLIALFASKLGNLLEAVNILGSLFYGTILGIFLVAFYFKSIGGKAVFWAAILTEIIVFIIWKVDVIAFLWLNLIGCIIVILMGWLLQQLIFHQRKITK